MDRLGMVHSEGKIPSRKYKTERSAQENPTQDMQETNKPARTYVLTAGGDEHPGRLSNIQEEDEIQSKKSRSVQQSIEAQEN